MAKPYRWMAAGIVVIAAGAALLSVARRSPGPLGPSERIVLGPSRNEVSSLVYLADSSGLFRRNGLEVELRPYDVGLAAVQDLLAGKIDVACAADFVVARTVLEHPDVRVLSVIAEADNYRVVGRGDRGIASPADLKGRKIGVHRDTIADFFLSRFLLFNGISEEEIEIVPVKTSEGKDALVRGEVDAIVTFEPGATEAAEAIGTAASVFPAQHGQGFYWLLLSTEAALRQKPQAAVRLLAALGQAEDLLNEKGQEVYDVVVRRLGLKKSFRHLYSHRLSLSQPLLIALEEDARWLTKHGKVSPKEIPNYLDRMYFDALDSARKDADTIVH